MAARQEYESMVCAVEAEAPKWLPRGISGKFDDLSPVIMEDEFEAWNSNLSKPEMA